MRRQRQLRNYNLVIFLVFFFFKQTQLPPDAPNTASPMDSLHYFIRRRQQQQLGLQ